MRPEAAKRHPPKSYRRQIPKTTPRPPKRKNRTAKFAPMSATGEAISTITANTLQSKEFPPLQYAVDGYLAEGVTLLAGKPKIGKSWMALDFAMAVATGDLALGSVRCRQGPVLYCALEDNHRRLKRRMSTLYGDVEHWPPGLHFATRVRVRNRAAGNEKVRFTSSILPPYLRKAKSVGRLRSCHRHGRQAERPAPLPPPARSDDARRSAGYPSADRAKIPMDQAKA